MIFFFFFLFFWRTRGLRIIPIYKLAEWRQYLNRNFLRAVWWSAANACYLVWLFRFIKLFSIALLYYLCKIIHILLFITINIWLQHNPTYSGRRDYRSATYNTQIGCRRSLVLLRFLVRCFILPIGLFKLFFRTFFWHKEDIINTSWILTINRYRFNSRFYIAG